MIDTAAHLILAALCLWLAHLAATGIIGGQ